MSEPNPTNAICAFFTIIVGSQTYANTSVQNEVNIDKLFLSKYL